MQKQDDASPVAQSNDATERTRRGVTLASRGSGRGLTQPLADRLPGWAMRIRAEDVLPVSALSRRRQSHFTQQGFDARRTLRSWTRAGARQLHVLPGKRYRKPGTVSILWDVSGSMSELIPLYLPWVQRLVSTSQDVGVYAFGVRVAELTACLRGSYAAARASLQNETDLWESGTSIGLALQEWVVRFGRRQLRGRSTVLLISDGWDSGQPEEVATALRTFRRQGARILWVHPLLRTPGFSLGTRALLAARPYVDQWIPGTTITDLTRIVL